MHFSFYMTYTVFQIQESNTQQYTTMVKNISAIKCNDSQKSALMVIGGKCLSHLSITGPYKIFINILFNNNYFQFLFSYQFKDEEQIKAKSIFLC